MDLLARVRMNENIKISVLTSLYNCENFLQNYFDALAKIEGKDQIEILILHNAPKEKELDIINKNLPSFDFIRHIIIPEREGLYRTWNRGIQLSEGEYITVWNVDDVRFPNSILQQAEALDKNPQAAIAYGDIWVSSQYGICGTRKTKSPVYSRFSHKKFLSEYHISCFQMWRKSIHSIVGYYDEQFKCIADFDFQIRAALHFPFVKTDEPLGIYLEDQPHKLSYNGLQPFEYNILCLRYGDYRYMNFFLLPEAKKKYQQKKMLIFEEWKDFTEKSPFGWFFKIREIVYASFNSVYWLCRQIAKKLLSIFKKQKKC
ncbi:MAG: glycosyltransferase [Candidatus Azobacteroides sp.]|nr:glycosyltransferase [Candidatus Azobacteroides sp.]